MSMPLVKGLSHSTPRYDLLVIGGGPGGCAAAISAKALGLRVVVIDALSRARQLPGETLHPGVESLFLQLGVWASVEACQFHRHTGIWHVGLNGARHFIPYGGDDGGPWRGYQVERVAFHQCLRQRAVAVGVDWLEAKALACAGIPQHDWEIVLTSGRSIKASAVIDATGRRAWLAEQIGLLAQRGSEPQRVQFGWDCTGPGFGDGSPTYRETKDGWDWEAPVGQGRAAWVRLRRGSGSRGRDMAPRIYRNCAGPGWFLIGDAACVTTPASGNGVLRALMSGIYASHIHAAVSSGYMSREAGGDTYCCWMNAFWESSVVGAESSVGR
jgi:flavin-dependent dehydrogenase